MLPTVSIYTVNAHRRHGNVPRRCAACKQARKQSAEHQHLNAPIYKFLDFLYIIHRQNCIFIAAIRIRPIRLISLINKRLGTAIIKYHGSSRHAPPPLIVHSAQRCASHSLRFTSPFSTLSPTYTHLRNCSCMSSVDAPVFILRSNVDDFRLPSPRL